LKGKGEDRRKGQRTKEGPIVKGEARLGGTIKRPMDLVYEPKTKGRRRT